LPGDGFSLKPKHVTSNKTDLNSVVFEALYFAFINGINPCARARACLCVTVGGPLLKHGTAAFYTGFLGHGGVSWSFSVLPGQLQIIYNSLFIIILPFDTMYSELLIASLSKL
jgi:hypothetical protein